MFEYKTAKLVLKIYSMIKFIHFYFVFNKLLVEDFKP